MSGLGIAGSALALTITQAVGLFSLAVYIYVSRHPLRLGRRDLGYLRIGGTAALALAAKAGPTAVQFLWGSVEQLLMISLVNRFGADATAGYGAVTQLWNFIMMPAVALGVAITAVVAQNIGAARWDRVRRAACLGMMYAALATAALVGLVEALHHRAFGIFLLSGSPALSFADQINREATWAQIFFGAYTVWVGVLRAAGIVWIPVLIAAGVLAVRFPVTAALLHTWHANAIWWSFPASAAMTGLLAALHGILKFRAREVLRQDAQASVPDLASSMWPASKK